MCHQFGAPAKNHALHRCRSGCVEANLLKRIGEVGMGGAEQLPRLRGRTQHHAHFSVAHRFGQRGGEVGGKGKGGDQSPRVVDVENAAGFA